LKRFAIGGHWLSLLAAGLALGLAWKGEARIEAGDPSWAGVLLCWVGILIFALTTKPQDRDSVIGRAGVARENNGRSHSSLSLFVFLILAAAAILNIVGLTQLTLERWDSKPALALWLSSVLLVVTLAFAARRHGEWSPRWNVSSPAKGTRWWLLGGAAAAVLVLAAAARLLWLDQVPRGINPDEGDRAAVAIALIRGDLPLRIFDLGWYYISIVYFWILAQVMKIAGVSFVGARVLGAACGIVTTAAVTWIGIRHFGHRVGLIAGGLFAVLGVALQFSRETTEATPTAMLWTLSAATLFEATRCGRPSSWILAGLLGGTSIYFYPTGRLWWPFAGLYSIYLLAHGLRVPRHSILRGAVLAAVASLIVASPYLYRVSERNFEFFTLRARQTSIFLEENPRRLHYYNPEWSTARLLQAQVERSLGLFNRYDDKNGFWPTHRPLMWGWLAVLTLVGLGWISLRFTDPRFVLLAVWFWIGFSGVIVTVDTPSLQRMATAVPVLAFLPALVLDSIGKRFEALLGRGMLINPPAADASAPPSTLLRTCFAKGGGERSEQGILDDLARAFRWLTNGAIAIVVIALMLQQWRFYFHTYAAMDEWSEPTLMGMSVNEQGPDTQVVGLGRQSHTVDQGWVVLLAPEVPRLQLPSPGHGLPLMPPPDFNLTFMVMPQQPYYLPYLHTLYPGGRATPKWERGQVQFTLFRIEKEDLQSMRGAFVALPQGELRRVANLGDVPRDIPLPALLRWTAAWRAESYGRYAFRIGPGPARLAFDGVPIVQAADDEAATAVVELAKGEHFIEYSASAGPKSIPPPQWTAIRTDENAVPESQADWRPFASDRLRAVQSGPEGLLGIVRDAGAVKEKRIDGTLAFGNLSGETGIGGRPFEIEWTGALTPPTAGAYAFSMFAQGRVRLQVGDRTVLETEGRVERPIEGTLDLKPAPHRIRVLYRVDGGPGGLEWMWQPPGGELSIVPRTVLSPPR
jgi:4-amino-4-deoxy-L-arabinose transferase-like glycosyltransferase